MKKYNADIDLGNSGFNMIVEAENDHLAIHEVHLQLACQGITCDEIESIFVSEL
jgi:hypothetical protein